MVRFLGSDPVGFTPTNQRISMNVCCAMQVAFLLPAPLFRRGPPRPGGDVPAYAGIFNLNSASAVSSARIRITNSAI